MNRPQDAAASDVQAEASSFGESAQALLAGLGGHSRLRGTQSGFDRSVWRTLAEAGWWSVLVPETQGGLGLRLPHAAAVCEEVGRALLPEPVIGAGVQAIASLCALPAGDLRDTLIARLTGGDDIVGVAWQAHAGEPAATTAAASSSPSTTASSPTTCTRAGDQHILDGRKVWVVPGVGADGWLVASGTGSSIALHWVPASAPGLVCEPLPRVDGSTMACLVLRDVRVPASHCLATGEPAQAAMSQGLDVARLMQAAELLGVARHAFDTTLDYLKTRQQFGRPIGANQALQHRMVDALLQLELASAGLQEALQVRWSAAGPSINAGESANDARALAMAASRAKSRCAHAALHITRLAVQFQKDIIIRQGENISARELEDVLADHPAVAEVTVVGVPDAQRGEMVCCVVVARGDQALDLPMLCGHLVDRGLPVFKLPERLQLLPQLPTNAGGKVRKPALQAWLAGDPSALDD